MELDVAELKYIYLCLCVCVCVRVCWELHKPKNVMKTQVIVGRAKRKGNPLNRQAAFTLYARRKYKCVYIRTHYNVKLSFALFTPQTHISRV